MTTESPKPSDEAKAGDVTKSTLPQKEWRDLAEDLKYGNNHRGEVERAACDLLTVKEPVSHEAAERMVRPVRCYLCNEPMHYAGQPGHVPEVLVEVHGEDSAYFYAHVSCWNQLVAARPDAPHELPVQLLSKLPN